MKKSITGAVALLAGAFVAHSQGTVSFANYLVLSPYITVSLGSTAIGGTGSHTGTIADTGNGNDWTVELYGNTGANDAASTLTPAIVDGSGSPGTPVTASLETGGSDSTAGTWVSSAVGDIAGTTLAGQAATVQVYAWYNDNGTITSYAAAKAAGLPSGFSATGNVTTGGPNTSGPPSTASPLPALGNITLTGTISTIPEPSTIALGVMGASAFLLRLRKK